MTWIWVAGKEKTSQTSLLVSLSLSAQLKKSLINTSVSFCLSLLTETGHVLACPVVVCRLQLPSHRKTQNTFVLRPKGWFSWDYFGNLVYRHFKWLQHHILQMMSLADWNTVIAGSLYAAYASLQEFVNVSADFGLKHPLYDRRVDVSNPFCHHKSKNISWMYLNKSKNKSHCSDF